MRGGRRMNKKISVFAIVLMAVVSSLFVNPALAVQIRVFAPLNYVGQPPSYPTAFRWWGTSCLGTASATINQLSGFTTMKATGGIIYSACANSYFMTNKYWFTGPTQTGSVHADVWLEYGINATGAGVGVELEVYAWNNTFCQGWRKRWTDALPTPSYTVRNATADIGINPYDLSVGGFRFKWFTNCWYEAIIRVYVFAGANTLAFVEIGKFDDVSWITYTSSTDEDWVQSASDPQIVLSPPFGPNGSQVIVNGTGFAPSSPVIPVPVYIYYDDGLVNKTMSDAYGNFTCSFKASSAKEGFFHVVKAIDSLENMAFDFFDVFIEAPPITGDITGPQGVPDGKIDMRDIGAVAKNFGKTDPNVDPPEEATEAHIAMVITVVMSILAFPLSVQWLRKKRRCSTYM